MTRTPAPFIEVLGPSPPPVLGPGAHRFSGPAPPARPVPARGRTRSVGFEHTAVHVHGHWGLSQRRGAYLGRLPTGTRARHPRTTTKTTRTRRPTKGMGGFCPPVGPGAPPLRRGRLESAPCDLHVGGLLGNIYGTSFQQNVESLHCEQRSSQLQLRSLSGSASTLGKRRSGRHGLARCSRRYHSTAAAR